MRYTRSALLALLLAVCAGVAHADGPKLDPKRIINESSSFLKEREPEMTEEEYALYQKVVTMLSTNPDFALKLLEAMMSDKEQPSPAFRFILGNAYYAAGMNDKSEENYRSAVVAYPSFLRAWVNLGILYYSTGRFADAVPCFSKAVVLGDRDSTTFGLLGFCLQKQGDLVSAEMAYMQALSGDPSNVDWKEGLLGICIDGKQFTRAESLVKNLVKERPSDTRYWLTYANILLAEGRKLEATVLLETAAGTGVANVEVLTTLGDLYAEQGLVPEAAGIYGRVLTPSPEIGEKKLVHYTEVLIAAGRLSDAERVLGVMKPGAGGVGVLQARADLLAAQGKWPEARREIEELLKVAPMDGRALVSLGRAYNAEDDVPRATLAFEADYRIPASAYVASLELANIELKNRHFSKTVEYLEKALSIEKTDAVQDFLVRVKTLAAKDS